MGKKSPPSSFDSSISTSAFFGSIRSCLRRLWMRTKVRANALKRCRRENLSENKKLKWEYQCNMCNCWFRGDEVEVNHKIPCGSLNSFSDMSLFTENLFCSVEGLEVLCKSCHKSIKKNN
jgi:hypothetical protein